MTELQKLEKDLEPLLKEVVAYNVKPNKSISARVRKGLGSLKKETTNIRAKLVAADKAGY